MMGKLGVPPRIIFLLKKMHATIGVKFGFDELTRVMLCVAGVKQGDLLGPGLFTFFIAAIMIAKRKIVGRLS